MSEEEELNSKRQIREECYSRQQISASVRAELEIAIAASPAARVDGGRSIYNMRTRGTSPKSDKDILTESHTIEQVHKWECEISRDVLAIYTQVPIKQLVRMKNGRRHVANARLNALVFTTDDILVRECKALEWLRKEVSRDGTDWELRGARFNHVPLNEWSLSRGLTFDAWCPPEPLGRYASNLSTVASSRLLQRDEKFLHRAEEVLKFFRDGKLHFLSSLLYQGTGISYECIEFLMAEERLFGTMRSKLIDQSDFIIGTDRAAIQLLDDAGMTVLSILDAPAQVKSWLNTTSSKHIEAAAKRLTRLQNMERGIEPWTRSMKSLRKSIEHVWTDPQETLRVLVPRYDRCGNRVPRLTEANYELLDSFRVEWQSGRWSSHLNAWGGYLQECEQKGLAPASKTALYSALRTVDPEKRALATEGVRGFQRVRKRTEPSKRSIPSIKVRHTAYIDSTILDIRTSLVPGDREVVIRGWVYICRDAHGMPLARSYVIDSPRTQGVALLWRNYVWRWGELPSLVHEDCGPDQTSGWHFNFARGRFDLRLQQTGNSRANQPAEDLQNHVNSYVCHSLEGNTLADRKGRAVDGRFKSTRTTRHAFGFITAGIDDFLGLDAPEMLNQDLITYRAESEHRVSIYGSGGRKVAYDDDLMIATSLPVKSYKCSEQNGIRTKDGYFLNSELQTKLRSSRPSQVLADAANPALLWVQTEGAWFKAWRGDALKHVDASDDYNLSIYFTQGDVRAARRKHREEIKIRRRQKLKQDAELALNSPPMTDDMGEEPDDLDALPAGFSVDPASLYEDI